MKKYFYLVFVIIFLSACTTNIDDKKDFKNTNTSKIQNLSNIDKIDIDKLYKKIDLLQTKVDGYELKINNLQKQIDEIRNHPISTTNSEEITKKLEILQKEIDPTNSYTYANTFLPNYQEVVVYYGTGEDNLNKKMLVSKNEIKKGIIVFKGLKDGTKYHYKIYGDGILISNSYFETSKLDSKVSIKGYTGDEIVLDTNQGKINLKFVTENVKKIDKVTYRKTPLIDMQADLDKLSDEERQKVENQLKIFSEKEDKEHELKLLGGNSIDLNLEKNDNFNYMLTIYYTDKYGEKREAYFTIRYK